MVSRTRTRSALLGQQEGRVGAVALRQLALGALALSAGALGCDDGGDNTRPSADASAEDTETGLGDASDVAPPDGVGDGTARGDVTEDPGPDTEGDTAPDAGVEPVPALPTFGPVAEPPTGSTLPAEVAPCDVVNATACVGGARMRCAIYDTGSGAWSAAPPAMTEQAFFFDRYLDLYHEAEGQTVDIDFTQPVPRGTPESEWSKPEYYAKMSAYGDASGWTGTALWAAAARYAVTGTEADYARMLSKFDAMMFLYEVTEAPGMLARSHWAMLPEGAPDPVGTWGQAIGEAYPADGSGWHYHYPIGEGLLDRVPAYYTEGLDIGGTRYPTEARWQGDASRDMYVRSLPGVMMAYDLLPDAIAEGSEEARLKSLVEAQLPCTLNRMKKARISNLQDSPELVEAVTGFLAGGALTLDDGDLDFSTLDTIVIYYMEQENPGWPENFDPACPDGPPMAVDPEYDLDASSPTFILDLLAFAQRQGRDSERPIAWPMAVSVRASDLVFMLQWALTAHYLTGDEAYLAFLEQLVDEVEFEGVLGTYGAFQLPRWCYSHYAPSLAYPTVWNLLARLDAQAAPELAEALAVMARDEVKGKEMVGRDDALFGVLYHRMVTPDVDPERDAFVQDMVTVLEGYGMNPEDKLGPDRRYTQNLVDPPDPDVTLVPLSDEERALCEAPVELFGVTVDEGSVSDENPRSAEALPLSKRLGGGFLWTQDPWLVLRDFGASSGKTQYPMVGMTLPYWLGRVDGTITEGEGLALGWQDTGESCGGGG